MPRLAEHLAIPAARLGDAVGEEHERSPAPIAILALRVWIVSEQA
jgi:hypothetical protein